MDIQSLVLRISEWGKSYIRESRKKNGKPVYFSDEHRATAEHAEHLSYHSEFGKFPAALIENAAPNETKEEFEYRKANYKQVTKPAWDKALSFVYRIFNEQNYRIEWKEEDYFVYFQYQFPKYGNFVNIFQSVIPSMKFADPNAVVVVKPYKIPVKYMYDEDGTEYEVPDQSVAVSPYFELFKSKNVFEYVEGEYALLLRSEKTIVTNNGKEVREGLFFEFYDANSIYYIKQRGERDDFLFELEEYYNHGYNSLPCWRLRGVPVYEQDNIYYHSYFSGALPNLDMAAVFSSTLFGVTSKVAYPTRWYYSDSCSTCNGEKFVFNGEEKHTCSTCNGTGKKFTFSPFKDYEIPMPENVVNADTTSLPTPPLGYVETGTNAMTFLDEKINALISEAFANLNIDITNAPNGQTATEKSLDREEAFSFLVQISGECFALMQDMFDAMGYMRWMDGYEDNRIKVIEPAEFSIRSSDVLTKEFSEAQAAKLPTPYLTGLLKENMRQRFKGDAMMEAMFDVVSKVDPLIAKDDMQVASLLGAGVIQKWQAVLHNEIYNIINKILSENPNFLDGDIWKDIYPELERVAKSMVVVTGSPEDILNRLVQ